MGHDAHGTRKRLAVELQQQIRRWERGIPRAETALLSTGCAALDALFPSGGARAGNLVEWLGEGVASGAGTVSLVAGHSACAPGRPVVLVDPGRRVSPLALSTLGIPLERLVIVRPDSERDTLWACEESLRCEAVGLVWAEIERLPAIAFRRLRLAVEESGSVGFLLRTERCLGDPSWAEVRLQVRPRPSSDASPRFRVDVAYSQGRSVRSSADILIDSQRGTIHEDVRSSAADPVPVAS